MTFGEWLKWFGNLFVKEILTYFIDPASRFILIVPLIIQIFLFGYTATFDLNHAPIAVLNESHGKYSQQLVAQVGASPTFYIRRYLQNASQMKDELNPRDSLAIVHIQSDFDSKLAQGKEGPVQIITDGRNSTTAGLAAAELSMIIQDFNHRYVGVPEGINVEMRAWYNPNLQTQSLSVLLKPLLSFFLRCFGLIFPCEGLFYRFISGFSFLRYRQSEPDWRFLPYRRRCSRQ